MDRAGKSILYGKPVSVLQHKVHIYFENVIEQAEEENKADETAIYHGDHCMTFRDLNNLSNQIARVIVSKVRHMHQDVKSSSEKKPSNKQSTAVIGLMCQPSAERIAVLLAILKAGAAYVALDATFPTDRTKYMIEESEALAVITDTKSYEVPNIPFLALEDVLSVVRQFSAKALEMKEILPNSDESTDLLHAIFFTSGTTGKPKAVQITHKNIQNALAMGWNVYPEIDNEMTAQFFSLLSVVSPCEIWLKLLKLKPLVVIPQEAKADPQIFIKMMERYKITTLIGCSPTYMKNLITILKSEVYENYCVKDSLKYVGLGSEIVSAKLIEDVMNYFNENLTIMINYGMSETTMAVTGNMFQSKENMKIADNGKISIGQALGNNVVYILNDKLELVNEGIVGQISVSGGNVTQGYMHEKEDHNFLPNHIDYKEGHEKIFLTSDYGYIKNGYVYFDGRKSTKVMVHGYRVSTVEIEEVIREIKQVKLVGVIGYKPPECNDDSTVLVAYYCTGKGTNLDEATVLQKCKEKLPPYAVPKIIKTEDIPTIPPHHKLNYPILHEWYSHYLQSIAAKKNCITNKLDATTLKQLLSEITQVTQDDINLDLSFFESGGDSVSATAFWMELKKCGYKGNISELCQMESLQELLEENGIMNKVDAGCKIQDFNRISTQEVQSVEEMFIENFGNHRQEYFRSIFPNYNSEIIDWKYVTQRCFKYALNDPYKLSFVMHKQDNKENSLAAFCFAYDQRIYDFSETDPKTTANPGLKMIADEDLLCYRHLYKDFFLTELPKHKQVAYGEYFGCMRSVSVGEAFNWILIGVSELIRRCREKKITCLYSETVIPLIKEIMVEQGAVVWNTIHLASYQDGNGKKPFGHAPNNAYYYLLVLILNYD